MGYARDIRTLCNSCRDEYFEAGYQLKKVWVKNKEVCDKCRVRLGWSYEMLGRFRSSDGESAVSYQFRCREFESHRK